MAAWKEAIESNVKQIQITAQSLQNYDAEDQKTAQIGSEASNDQGLPFEVAAAKEDPKSAATDEKMKTAEDPKDLDQ